MIDDTINPPTDDTPPKEGEGQPPDPGGGNPFDRVTPVFDLLAILLGKLAFQHGIPLSEMSTRLRQEMVKEGIRNGDGDNTIAMLVGCTRQNIGYIRKQALNEPKIPIKEPIGILDGVLNLINDLEDATLDRIHEEAQARNMGQWRKKNKSSPDGDAIELSVIKIVVTKLVEHGFVIESDKKYSLNPEIKVGIWPVNYGQHKNTLLDKLKDILNAILISLESMPDKTFQSSRQVSSRNNTTPESEVETEEAQDDGTEAIASITRTTITLPSHDPELIEGITKLVRDYVGEKHQEGSGPVRCKVVLSIVSMENPKNET